MNWTLFTGKMLDWYRHAARVLPWRKNRDPYRIWVSEIMLQQTRVDTVIPYYNRFMETFPCVEALANADETALLKHWEGLGYYTRARNLQKAAKVIMETHKGIFPDCWGDVRKLPGVGDYTAGAICSISFEQPTPAVDGNVLRVLSRLTADASDVMKPETRKQYTALLQEIYPTKGRGDFTQSLMELGALICLPGMPKCDACPVQTLCCAYAQGNPEKYPVKTPKKEKKVERLTVFLISDGIHLAISKREQGLLSNMWQFPNVFGWISEDAAREELCKMGYQVTQIRDVGCVKHIFTHIEWQMQVYRCSVNKVEAPYLTNEITLPTAFRKLLRLEQETE